MARTKKAANDSKSYVRAGDVAALTALDEAGSAPADINETANRADLNSRSMRSRTTLHNELVVSEGMRLAALQECDRLRSEIETLKSAAVPITTVVGIGALARCLGYRGSLMLSLVHDGMPHKMEDGTAIFDLPTVHRWMLDRREHRVLADYRDNNVVPIDADFDVMADTLLAAITFVTEEIDQTISDGGVPGKPETILDDEHFGPRLARLTDLARRLREAHADVPSPPGTPGKPAFVNLVTGQPWTGSEEAR